MALGPLEFECDCAGTGYEGKKCEVGIITVPQYPTLIAENPPKQLTISARPTSFITIEFISDDSDIFFDPVSVTIRHPNTTANFTVGSTRPNLYMINYVITGMNSDEFPTPQASTVLVTSSNSNPPNSYFTDRDLEIGLVKPGCCQLSRYATSYKCPNGIQSILFDSTCNWAQQENILITPGIVFATTINGLTLPASISGTELHHSNRILSLNQLSTSGSNEPCIKCPSDMAADSIPDDASCTTTFGPSINDINDFLNAESLAYSYFNYANSLYPSWLRLLPINGAHRSHDTNSYQVRLVDNTELEGIGCEGLPVVEDGLYSVLQYSGELNVSIPTIGAYEVYTPSDDASPLCFAVNLCAGALSPFYVSIPVDAQPFFKTLPFVSNLMDKGWVIDTEALAVTVGNNYLPVNVINRFFHHYWNGITDFRVENYFNRASLIVQGKVHRNFTTGDMTCVLEFAGLSSLQYNYDLNEVRYKTF